MKIDFANLILSYNEHKSKIDNAIADVINSSSFIMGKDVAVLEKKCGFKVGLEDIFLNITGGIKIEDPASDLAILAAIVSSREDISISSKVCFAGEVGLSGEVRPVQKISARIAEAQKLGFEKIYVSEYNDFSALKNQNGITIFKAKKIEQVFQNLFA